MKTLTICLGMVLLLCGCRTSQKTTMYLLSSFNELERIASADVRLELQRVSLPGYLNRREFVQRVGQYELKVLRTCVWADSADRSIDTIFRRNMEKLLGEENVLMHGADRTAPALRVDIRRMEPQDNVFRAEIRCQYSRTGKPGREKTLTWSANMDSGVPLVKYYNQCLADLARQVAQWVVGE